MKRTMSVIGSLLLGASVASASPNVQNNGFEQPQLSSGTWVANPSNFAGWTFSNTNDRKSGIANGSGAWGHGAATGTQYAFLQQDSKIVQMVDGFTPGNSYVLQFQMARRDGHFGADVTNSVDVQVGGTTVLSAARAFDENWRLYETQSFVATSSTLSILFQGLIANQDVTSLFDDIRVVSPTTITPGILVNGDFELPSLGSGGWTYNPSGIVGLGWRFMGQVGFNRGSGIAAMYSPWGQSASHGSQFAFLQRDGFAEQTLAGLTIGVQYQVRFSQSSRPGFPSHFTRVLIDGSEILAAGTASAGGWISRSTNFFTATSSQMTLRFQGIDGNVDAASLIDGVTVVPEPGSMIIVGAGILLLCNRKRNHLIRAQ